MFDIALRPAKDALIDPLIHFIPANIHPHQVTALAFVCGLISCISACTGYVALGVVFWALNRILDCLDGALARHRKQQSELGGFLDLLGDFIIYALTPLSVVCGNHVRGNAAYDVTALHLAITALLEASFFLNNFVLFYIAALIEKKNVEGLHKEKEEITSLAMRPALIEGFESGVFFTVMLAKPSLVAPLSSAMFVGVAFGVWQRSRWLIVALSRKNSA
jgi:phosphatidylglycerophosphate synthase